MGIYRDITHLPDFRDTVLTIGTFDGVHRGHRAILDEVVQHARREGRESVLLTFEPHPRKLLFPDQSLQLLTPLSGKLELLQAAGIQHIVVVPFTREFAALDARAYVEDFLVARFRPNCIVIGYDHHFGSDRSGNIRLLRALQEQWRYTVYEIPAQLIDDAAVSSTKIRQALGAGDVVQAAQMLGRPYQLSGTVVDGARLGRTIGYPTANIEPADADQLVPATGVYAVRVRWQDRMYDGMLNIGFNPTVTDDGIRRIEVHLFHFNETIYGEELDISFIARLRDEEKFPSLEALKDRLHRDAEEAQAALNEA
jgi:riboflavin kinase/FMN adenylyltransferase